jgi:D-arabinose 1-dehydrogenase-like Zn-dependent alcohol dehydrogenase
VDAVDSADFAAVRLPVGWGGKVDVVVDLLGSAASLYWSLGALEAGGRLVLLTTFRETTVPVSPRSMVLGQSTVLGSRYASRHDLLVAAEHVAAGRVQPVVSKTADWTEVDHLHDLLLRGQLFGRGALVWSHT